MIASVTKPFCGGCSRARLSARGSLYTCLFAQKATICASRSALGASDEKLAGVDPGRVATNAPTAIPTSARPRPRPCPRSKCRISAAESLTPPARRLESLRDGRRRSRAPDPPSRMDRFRPPGRDLARLLLQLPGRSEPRRPRSRQGVRQRVPRDRARAAHHAALRRADGPARRRLVQLAADGGRVDVLELRVHGHRADPALGLSPAARLSRASGTRSCSRT